MKLTSILLALLGSVAVSHGALVAYLNFNTLADGTNATALSSNDRTEKIRLNAVPEPASAFLGSLGMLALLRRRR